jgi:hypothetical protein
MNSKRLAFLLGVLAGGCIATVLLTARAGRRERGHDRDQLKAQVESAAGRIAELDEELARAKGRDKKLETENQRLVARIEELSRLGPTEPARIPSPTPAPAVGRAADTNRIDAVMRLMGQAGVEMRVEGQLLQLKRRVALRPDQETSAREILNRLFDPDRLKERGTAQTELQALLTPEQQEAFREMQQEERKQGRGSQALSTAQSELSSMRSNLGLSQEQMDKAWPVLYESVRTQFEDELLQKSKKKDPAVTAAALTRMEEVMKTRLEGLNAVLTAEQFAIYEKYQRQYLLSIQMMKAEQ